jgi:hypothetical protein
MTEAEREYWVIIQKQAGEIDQLKQIASRSQEALKVAFRYSQIDGDHHRAWAIDQMVRALTGDEYDEWVKNFEEDEDGSPTYEWYVGIAP